MNVAGWRFVVNRARWLIYRKEDALKKIEATGILVFDLNSS